VSMRALIVCPVTSSVGSETSIACALALANEHSADLHLLRVVPNRSSLRSEASPGPSMADGKQQTSSLGHAVCVRSVSLRGDATKVIPAYATLKSADMVVIDRDYGAARFRRQSNVGRSIARSAPCPVLIVPPQRSEADIRHSIEFREILCAVDFTVASAVAMRAALDFARRSAGRLTLLHMLDRLPRQMVFSGGEVEHVRKEHRERAYLVSARLWREVPVTARKSCDVRPVVLMGSADRGIRDMASEIAADLVVMGVAPRGTLDRMLFGSTSAVVVRQATCPVLLVPVVAGAHEWLEDTSRLGERVAENGDVVAGQRRFAA
jgi:nucleotide-binding universal stress UspA family protein